MFSYELHDDSDKFYITTEVLSTGSTVGVLRVKKVRGRERGCLISGLGPGRPRKGSRQLYETKHSLCVIPSSALFNDLSGDCLD